MAVNTGFKSIETSYLLEHSQAKLALIDPQHGDMFERMRAELPRLEQVLVHRGRRALPVASATCSSEPGRTRRPVDVSPDDVISFIYTSGTTGKPKAVMQTQRNFVMTGQAYPTWMGMERGDRIYACLPLFHINSQAYSTMAAIGSRGADRALAPVQCHPLLGRHPQARRGGVQLHRRDDAHPVEEGAAPDDRDHSVKVAYGVPAPAR